MTFSATATARERNGDVQVGTMILVTAITLLIWIWAAGETRERTVLSVDIEFQSASQLQLVVSPRAPQRLKLTVIGSARSMRQLHEAFETPLALVLGSEGVPSVKGTHSVDLAEALNAQSIFDRLDVALVSVEPAHLEIELDALTEQTVVVNAILAGATISGEAVADPPMVTLTLPSRIVALVPNTEVLAEPLAATISELEPGRRQTVQTSLTLPPSLQPWADEISIEPSFVELSFTLIERTRTTLIPSVPVQIAAPAEDLAQYDVRIADANFFLADVLIEGPAELIRNFESEKTPVLAFIHLTSDDLVRGVTEAPVTLWQLPVGLRVRSVDGGSAQPFVPVEVAPRNNSQ